MSGKGKLPKGWRLVKLGEIALFLDNLRKPVNESERQERINGKDERDLYPYFGANGQVGWIDDYLFDEDLILLAEDGGAFGSEHTPIAYQISGKTWVNNHAHVLKPIEDQILGDFLYYSISIRPDVLPLVSGSTRAKLNQKCAKEIPIHLPPLAVQERIVEVLQQAEAIRRKRAEARRLADQILPALFFDMFGDPIKNSRNWPLRRIGSFCRVVRGAHPRPAGDPQYFNGDIPIAYISDVTAEPSRFLRKTKLTVTDEGKRKSRFLKEGTLVVTGNTTTGIPKILAMDCCVHDGFRAFTELSNDVDRDYLYWYFRNTVEFYERLTPGEGLRGGLKVSDYNEFEIPFPAKPYQTQLAETLNRAEDILLGQLEALPMQENTFTMLLSRAFTGELTAEWEAANADWIVERQVFYERLPRLALLSLLLGCRERAGRNAVTLITALMKYAFLAQMEGELRRRLYRFVPYHYGPWAMELYDDLKALAAEGLITVENDAEEDKTRIKLSEPARAAALLEEESRKDDVRLAALDKPGEDTEKVADPAMPRLLKRRAEILETLLADTATILDSYGNLDQSALLKTVCEKYPSYAKKSRVRKARRNT